MDEIICYNCGEVLHPVPASSYCPICGQLLRLGRADRTRELPRLRSDMDQEVYFRLLPGYVRQYIEQAAPLLDTEVEGDMNGAFFFRPARFGAMDSLLPALELYPERARDDLFVKDIIAWNLYI